ncbi:MAG: hypothetical protein HZB41_02170 [Ignavibacteriae bacterium]|nr:hypothetical protein [Ignavibacteriota bacterium]
MNSYYLGITGPWWLTILLILFAVAFAIFSYRKTIPPISSSRKIVLITLRSIGLSLLLFIMFEPILTIIKGSSEPPKLVVLLDNSLSIAQSDAVGDRKILYKNAINNSDFSSIEKENFKTAIFGNEVYSPDEFSLKEINYKGQMTDISKAIKWVSSKSENENIQAVLLITDGAFNAGNNPIYDAEFLGKPIFTIGIGDSTQPKDVSIQSIITNENIYINNPIPVNVNIKVSGYNEGELNLKLLDNGSTIAEQKFTVNPDRKSFTAVFEYSPKQEGIRKLTATINSLNNEITNKNNSANEFVNVLKNKRKIAIFSGSINPDFSFVKNSFLAEKGVDVISFIQKKGSEFYDRQPNETDVKDAEMIVLIGFPISETPANVIQIIKKELEKGKPLLFIASQFLDYNKLRALEEYLPFTTISSKPQEFLAIPDVKPEYASNPLLRVTGKDSDIDLWNQLPPVFRTETFVKVKPESEIVSGLKVNNAPLKEPLILTRAFGNKKSVAFLCYGLFRWKLLGYASELSKGRTGTPDLLDIIIENSRKWLSTPQDNKQVIIRTTKKLYTNNETVEFLGQIYDAANTPIENANVLVKVSGGNQERDLTLTSIGNGRYSGKLDGLSESDYYFSGTAINNGNKIGSDKGRFNVGQIALEFQDLRMNSSLLRTISDRTGGKFYLPENAKSFLKDLENLKNFKPKSVTIRNESALWNLPLFLIISILCFGIEWFLRKRAGML